MQERFETQWKNRSFNDKRNNPKVHNKLRTFRTFKYTFKHEPYIDQISHFNDRRNFCRLRISAYNLNIELGRHTGVDSERHVCNKCNLNSLEDELHAFMYCPAHDPQRQILFHYISTNYKNFHQLDGEQKFIWLMSNEDIKVMSKVTKFVTTMLQPNEWPCPGLHFSDPDCEKYTVLLSVWCVFYLAGMLGSYVPNFRYSLLLQTVACLKLCIQPLMGAWLLNKDL